VAVIVAHPDDETLGLGGQFGNNWNLTFIYTTDGAPRYREDARDYADIRRKELRCALKLAGLKQFAILESGIADQEAAFRLQRLIDYLANELRELRPDAIFTHPFEGGHADHDATALAVRQAVNAVCPSTPVIEFTSYHARAGQLVCGEFLIDSDGEMLSIRLSPQAYALKRRTIECFATQRHFIDSLYDCRERFRKAPHYDFARRPHPGPLFYETWDSGMTWEQWLGCISGLPR
jgi:LmbE family N-acetylglucosaminyl deacetylase